MSELDLEWVDSDGPHLSDAQSQRALNLIRRAREGKGRLDVALVVRYFDSEKRS